MPSRLDNFKAIVAYDFEFDYAPNRVANNRRELCISGLASNEPTEMPLVVSAVAELTSRRK